MTFCGGVAEGVSAAMTVPAAATDIPATIIFIIRCISRSFRVGGNVGRRIFLHDDNPIDPYDALRCEHAKHFK
jgi:hypothetical protein